MRNVKLTLTVPQHQSSTHSSLNISCRQALHFNTVRKLRNNQMLQPLCLQQTWSTQRPTGWCRAAETDIGTTNTARCQSWSDAVTTLLLNSATDNNPSHVNYLHIHCYTAPYCLLIMSPQETGGKMASSAAYNLWDNCCCSTVNFDFNLTVIRRSSSMQASEILPKINISKQLYYVCKQEPALTAM